MQKHKVFFYITIISWFMLLSLGSYFYFHYNLSLEGIVFGAKNYVLENPLKGIALFVLFYVLRPFFFVIASPFDLFSGMVFGPVYGFFISSCATFFSSMFSYGVGNVTGGNFIEKRKGKKIEKLREKLHKDTFFTALIIRFLLLPFDLSNYICGTLRAPFWKYVGGTVLGIMPATFVLVSAGSAFHGQNIDSYDTLLANIKYENLWFASGFFVTILIVSRILKRKYKNISL